MHAHEDNIHAKTWRVWQCAQVNCIHINTYTHIHTQKQCMHVLSCLCSGRLTCVQSEHHHSRAIFDHDDYIHACARVEQAWFTLSCFDTDAQYQMIITLATKTFVHALCMPAFLHRTPTAADQLLVNWTHFSHMNSVCT
jgi:hypothetical protein